MPSHDFDLGVIGGGAAGLTAAAGAAQLGAKCLLVEREPKLGGDCLHYGCVPSKTLIHTAKVRRLMADAGRFGLPAADLPPVDFRRVASRIQEVVATIQHHDSVERFCRLGARVEFGAAAFVDDHQIDLDGKRFSAGKWIVATGSSPAVPPIDGLRETPHLTNRNLFSLDRLPESMIVLGAGPIAIEMAQAFQRLGCAVQVIQRSPEILTKEDPDMAAGVRQALEAEGVVFHLGASVRRVRDLGGAREVLFEQAGVEKTASAAALLAAMGRRPNLASLRLDQAGVVHSARGVGTDRRMRTSQKHIFAAGDVTGRYQFTHAAGYEAGVALTNAVMRLPRKTDYQWLPWCTYADPELASIGLNETAAREQGALGRVLTSSFGANDRSLAEGCEKGMLKLVLDRKEQPLGVQILGPSAGELLAEWVAALNGGVKLSKLAQAVHPYPTLAEISKRVCGDLMAPKLFSDTVRGGLSLIFGLKGRACSLEDHENS
ncbi:MAG: dihydrolipoyl dehydrogenase family protein [Desulfovibrionaceae bacterium]